MAYLYHFNSRDPFGIVHEDLEKVDGISAENITTQTEDVLETDVTSAYVDIYGIIHEEINDDIGHSDVLFGFYFDEIADLKKLEKAQKDYPEIKQSIEFIKNNFNLICTMPNEARIKKFPNS